MHYYRNIQRVCSKLNYLHLTNAIRDLLKAPQNISILNKSMKQYLKNATILSFRIFTHLSENIYMLDIVCAITAKIQAIEKRHPWEGAAILKYRISSFPKIL